MECFDIANIGTAHCVASMVRFKNGMPDNSNYRRYRIRVVSGQNDFAAMSEVVRRRYSRILLEGRERMGPEAADQSQEGPLEAMRRLERIIEKNAEDEAVLDEFTSTEMAIDKDGQTTEGPPQSNPQSAIRNPKFFVRLPDLVIVDGGKGQLSSAMEELQRLGLQDLPIIGLAKEEEEIYRPERAEPLRLSHDTGALKLLQRIRDEAHRWANGYHQLLLNRRVKESVLDDCPGVSENRKAALLRAFGSITRLRRATAEEIAEVPGVGKALAEQVVSFLQQRGSE
jgi:excinuclease ABC subunit C